MDLPKQPTGKRTGFTTGTSATAASIASILSIAISNSDNVTVSFIEK